MSPIVNTCTAVKVQLSIHRFLVHARKELQKLTIFIMLCILSIDFFVNELLDASEQMYDNISEIVIAQ